MLIKRINEVSTDEYLSFIKLISDELLQSIDKVLEKVRLKLISHSFSMRLLMHNAIN
jgi:hypothetical protein